MTCIISYPCILNIFLRIASDYKDQLRTMTIIAYIIAY